MASNDPDEGSIDIPVILHVAIESTCSYVPGEINGHGNDIGSDITFGVNYFRGGSPLQDSCRLFDGTWLYVAGDANGSCGFIGSDITYMVGYFLRPSFSRGARLRFL